MPEIVRPKSDNMNQLEDSSQGAIDPETLLRALGLIPPETFTGGGSGIDLQHQLFPWDVMDYRVFGKGEKGT